MKKTVTIVAVLVAVQGLAVLLYLAVDRGRSRDDVEFERLARPAPELVLRSADGSATRLSDLRGSVVVLHFWATWCPPCREELPSLLRFAATGEAKVVAASVDAEWPQVLSFVGEDGVRNVFLTSADAVADRFGIEELPQTLVIDAHGTMRLRFRGPQDWTSGKLRQMIAAVEVCLVVRPAAGDAVPE